MVSKCTARRYLEKENNLQRRNSTLTKYSELTSLVTGHIPPDITHRGHITSIVFLPKVDHLNLIMRKHKTSSKWWTVYEINDLCTSKMSKSWKIKTEELFEIKGN